MIKALQALLDCINVDGVRLNLIVELMLEAVSGSYTNAIYAQRLNHIPEL